MKYIAVLVGIVSLGILGYFFAARETPVATDKVSVVTSFYPLYYLASEIGGDKVDVRNITPAGAEPHDYEPTPQDLVAIQESDLLVLNGAGFEAWGNAVAQSIDPQETVLVAAGEGLADRRIAFDGGEVVDPHIWLSPLLAQQMADKIAQGFAKADPENAAFYAERAFDLKARLGQLDTEYRQGLAHCKHRDVVTSHAAFGYLSAAYGLNQVPIAGLSPEEEPSAQDLANVADFAKKNAVSHIFFESLVSPKLSQTIAREIGARTLVLDPIEGISFGDRTAGKNYLSVMRDNLANLRVALQCN